MHRWIDASDWLGLTVFTAGTAGGDLRIEGLDEAMAEQLRVFVVGKVRGDDVRAPVVETEAADGIGLST